MADDGDGLVHACIFDGSGGARFITWPDVSQWTPSDGVLWLHLDYTHPRAVAWVEDHSGADALVAEALQADEPRPRAMARGHGLLLVLRGVNLNPGAEPEDMVSLRCWITERCIVTLRRRRIMAVQDVRTALAEGRGPVDPGAFLVDIAERLLERMSPVIHAVEDTVDGLEDALLSEDTEPLRGRISEVRHDIVLLRRHLAPQRDVLARLVGQPIAWLDEGDRNELRELDDRITRYVEALDSARDRAALTQDELQSRLSQRMERTNYVLSLVAAIFLPITFVTGMLGVNVAGIPFADHPWAFAGLCIILAAVVAAQLWWFRKRGWF